MSTIAAVLAATPSPSPSGVPDVDVTPGVAGFVAIAVVAIVTILLVLDMTRRIRRTRYRAEVRERLEAEVAGEPDDGAATDEPSRRAAEDGRADVGDDTERG
ncbi:MULTISPECIES: hypothetical protein [unclassified Curtobacterium]|uniref:hypothetical protein n=1 Tax=unclassified Curtobacterium TaxID=257496 RepID=UPI000D8CBAF6|nr:MULTISPECIES: hypothetical protein [unclassified Curtobacterium]PYY34930.1 hypothetical protein DEJ32_14540 [Curtobacterium sp. MCPF17_046]PYY49607.1 hypothetical protein DEI84_08050 [Curtobacterium sp. MCBD17_023]PZE95301.1 hypothetical protein DEI95_02785 [Curtobacterium sp. MCBD17_008]